MGCSNSSFEIQKSKDNIQDENRDDDLMVLMKKRMAENNEKEIETPKLTKIKNLAEDNIELNDNDENNNPINNIEKNDDENIMLINNGIEKNKMIFSQVENDKENKKENIENVNDKENNSANNINQINEDNEQKKLNNDNDAISQEDIIQNNEANNYLSISTSKNNISILDKYFKTKKVNKSFLNKSKSNIKINKDPFTLKTTKGDSMNISTLKINAPYFLREYLIPIWFEKDTFIKFTTSGKWRIDKTCEFTDTKGMPTPNTLDFNYGACIARIGSGEPFVIMPNNFTYITKNEGPLYLKMNLPRKLKVHPEGQIEMNIYDGTVLPIEEIYEKIGWKENNMKYENNKGSEIENGLMSAINNLRMNPVLFYEKYFRDIQNIIWIEKYLQEKEFKNKNNNLRKPFIVNNNCFNLLDKYVNINYVNKSNINRQKVSLYLNEMRQNLELYLNNNFKYKNYVNCKFTQKYKVNDICLQYLLDKKFRNFIFSNDYNYITVKVVENYIDESNMLIICLSKIDDNNENNLKENEDIN